MSIRRPFIASSVLFVVLMAVSTAPAQEAAPLSALARMPVKEVTIFKDGHAFVLHEGKMPVDAAGNVLMDYLPTPIMGTFWPYSNDKAVKLSAVVASQRKVRVERTALNIRQLLEANVGASVTITEIVRGGTDKEGLVTHSGTIVSLPERSSKELESTSPPGSGQMLPQPGDLVLVKLGNGGNVKAVNVANIHDVTLEMANPKLLVGQEELRHLLTLKLDWPKKAAPEKEADVGMMYVQRGLRWIPSYKLAIDGKGAASVKLEATLINELCDLEDVSANLVIGVPTFAFKDALDPIGMQQAMAQLSQYFEQAGQSRTRYGLSNALMAQSQIASNRAPEMEGEARPPADLGPEVGGGGRSEDLYVFPVKHVTLKKGQRMVLAVAEFALKYKDVYKLDIPFAPPREVWQNFDNARQAELARLFNAPKVMHNIRLTNDTKSPLTTAPVLILKEDSVLAQGMMLYTAPGGDIDLPITAAVDVGIKKSEKEIKRTPNAETWNKETYTRIDLAGSITLTDRRDKAVDIEVTRYVLGNATEAGKDGKVETINNLEDAAATPSGSEGVPYWWGWYSWPYWWNHFNSVGKIRWTVTLDPGKSVELTYSWNYLWR